MNGELEVLQVNCFGGVLAADRLGYFSSKASGGSENEVFGTGALKDPGFGKVSGRGFRE